MGVAKWQARLEAVNEYEREPIPETRRRSWGSFLSMYAGEHTAGTEFVIGPLFVIRGASAGDLVLGLLLGNILAVLSWAFICAPIAVRERQTLYYMLERICGSRLTLIYNLVNALMFCFLAGAMIAVAATAVGIPFGLPAARLTDWLPSGWLWIALVAGVGMVTTVVAMLGYQLVERFAVIAAPWMILVFLAAAIAVLPNLGVTHWREFWPVAQDIIWTGTPAPGQDKFTFWHILFFAWFCNMAMHIGMADLSILRYARRWTAGFASAGGMFLGHYVAWLASGILYAVFLQQYGQQQVFAPGPVAYGAAGIAGALCVVVAGWTTANPTIYRAGLALQALMPLARTWKITLVVGSITTLAACFPALVMKLLDFVALYGLVLMPMGALLFTDYWLFPRMGLQSSIASARGLALNWPALITWGGSLAACAALSHFAGLEIFFLGLPGWFIAAFLYLLTSFIHQKNLTT